MSAPEPLLVSIKDAAAMLGLSVMTIYRMFDRQELESVKIGNRRLVKTSSLRELAGEAL